MAACQFLARYVTWCASFKAVSSEYYKWTITIFGKLEFHCVSTNCSPATAALPSVFYAQFVRG